MAVTPVIRADRARVFVRATEGQSLLFRVEVRGVDPVFQLINTSNRETLLTNMNEPVRAGVWERRWPGPGDIVEPTNRCVLGLTFLQGITYTYQVEHSERGVLIDIDFTSTGHELAIDRNLTVMTL